MTSYGNQKHLTSQEIQGFLDRELTPREEASAREHLAVCPRCVSELEAWQLLFADLQSLPELAPPSRLAKEVMAQAGIHEPAGQRARGWVISPWSTETDEAHIPAWSIQDYLEGAMAPRPAARVKSHLDDCPSCRQEMAEWGTLLDTFLPLDRLSPSPGFSERVMERVMMPAPVPARRTGWSALPGRALAWARNVLPENRHGWAVVGGVASAPVITVAALVYLLFSRPALTPGALGSYLVWKGSELLGLLFSTVETLARESSLAAHVLSFLEPVTQSTLLLGLGGAGLSLLSAAALWVLYRNLIVTSSDERYARARM